MILEKVGREIFIFFAASICFNPARHARRTASNSSRVRYTLFNLLSGLHKGLKHLSSGAHFTHLVFFGLKHPS
jgi:phosphotransferase system  glucose/maltose/N-acetylglucosamine-specific IIC component